MNDLNSPNRRAVLRVATVAAISAAGATWMALAAKPACAADATSFEAAFAAFHARPPATKARSTPPSSNSPASPRPILPTR